MKFLRAVAAMAGLVAAAGPVMAAEITVPYRDCGGLICLAVPLGSSTRLFVLDTGNVTGTIDLAAARQIGLPLAPAHRRSQPDVAIPGMFKTDLPPDATQRLGLAATGIVATDLKDFQRQLGTRIAGTLAYPMFKDKVLRLDPKRHVLTVSDEAAAPAEGQHYPLRLVTFGSDGPPVLTAEGVTLNGQPFLAQLDTDFPEGALLFPPARDALGLGKVAPVGRRTLGYYDDHAELLRLPPGKADFGSPLFAEAGRHVFLPGRGVHFPENEIAMVVGTGWLRGKDVTLDFHAMTVTLAPMG